MILLTGSTGFLGGYLYREIAKLGQPIYKYSSSIEPLNTNLRTSDALGATSEVILCGGYVNHGNSSTQNRNEIKKSWNVINSILEIRFVNLPRITFFSTTDLYLPALDISETSQPYPTNEYTETKLLQEDFLRTFCKSAGLDFRILRIGNVYGPGENFRKKLIPTLIKSAIENHVFIQKTDSNYLVQPLYVDDLAKIVINILNDKTTEELINVVNPTSVSVGNLIEVVNSFKALKVEFSLDKSILPKAFNTARVQKYTPSDLVPIEVGIKNEIEYEFQRFNNR
jgi:nucleoside-diphosphate-sugar epimerase